MSGAWNLEIDADRVGILWFDLPGEKVNKLSSAAMLELESALESLEREKLKGLVIASRKRDCFIAGADIEEIKGVTIETAAYEACRKGQAILDRIAKLEIQTVAAIDGACLGGGLELALACDIRLASDNPKTKIGLPETRLGIIPGFGGTQRLPKVVGIQQGITMILKGSGLDGNRAYKAGLVHAVVPQKFLLEEAVKVALGSKKVHARKAKGFAPWFLEKTAVGRSLVFKKSRESVMKMTMGHYPAPLKAIDVVERTWNKPVDEGLEIEARACAPLIVSDVSKNLVHLYFLADGVKRKSGSPKVGAQPLSVDRVAVLGAGVMGGGIAQLAADRGLAVRMKDIKEEFLLKGLQEASRLFQKKVRRRRMKPGEKDAAMGRISPTLAYDGFRTVDVVIEAVVENMEVKRRVLGEVEDAAGGLAIFASNTSSLPITEIAKECRHPERVAGMHFFNPVSKMPLVEIIRGAKTSEETSATLFELAKTMGKVPVLCGDGPGFLVNRLLMPYLNESAYILLQGVPIQSVDGTMLDFGMPMGPAHLLDEVGLDIAYHVGIYLESCFPDRMKTTPLLRQIFQTGLKGKKGGKGFYLYDRAGKKGAVNPEIRELLPAPGISPPPEILVERMVLAMVNEASRVLEEGIVESAGDVDLGMIMGTGFPPFRGGLLKYADTLGTGRVVERLKHWADKEGSRFTPAPYLVDLAKNQKSFY